MANPHPVDLREIAKKKGFNSFSAFCSDAGKRSKGKPKRYRISEKRICRADKCPLWNVCFVKYLSPKFNGRCALYHSPLRVKNIILNSFFRGENAMNDNIIELLSEITINLRSEKDPEKQMKLLKAMMDAKKSIFGDKSRIEATVKNEDIDANRIFEIYKEAKNKPKKVKK